jgi:hypothetical protein
VQDHFEQREQLRESPEMRMNVVYLGTSKRERKRRGEII